MRISDWSADVCSSDLGLGVEALVDLAVGALQRADEGALLLPACPDHLLAGVVARLARLDEDFGFVAGGDLLLGHASSALRSDERRLGKEWFSTGRSRWSRYL